MKKTSLLLLISMYSFFTYAQIPAKGLVAFYPFNGNANDESGNGTKGIVEGATLATDRFGNENSAYFFDGIDDQITYDKDNFVNGNNLSVSVWVNYNQTSLKYFITCSDFGVFSDGKELGLAISLPLTHNASGSVNYDEWTHFVGTYDGTTIKSYVNGVLTEERLWEGDVSDLDRILTLGFFNKTYWKGYMDDICIYNRVISTTEIDELYKDKSSLISSIDSFDDKKSFEIFPNPTKGTFTITNISGFSKEVELYIYSINGALVWKQNYTFNEVNVDLSNLKKGVYFVQLHGVNFSKIEKLIIE